MDNALPTSIVIFGASGDLTQRKLVPSLFNLYRKGRLPKQFRIVGYGNTAFSDDQFRTHLRDGLKEFATFNEEFVDYRCIEITEQGIEHKTCLVCSKISSRKLCSYRCIDTHRRRKAGIQERNFVDWNDLQELISQGLSNIQIGKIKNCSETAVRKQKKKLAGRVGLEPTIAFAAD